MKNGLEGDLKSGLVQIISSRIDEKTGEFDKEKHGLLGIINGLEQDNKKLKDQVIFVIKKIKSWKIPIKDMTISNLRTIPRSLTVNTNTSFNSLIIRDAKIQNGLKGIFIFENSKNQKYFRMYEREIENEKLRES